MLTKLTKPILGRALTACGSAIALVLLLAGPTSADYRRSCHIVVEVTPIDRALEGEVYSFRVFNTTQRFSKVNDARRVIRNRVTSCVLTHWANRDADTRPPECDDWGRVEMAEYPFDNMFGQFRDDICDANRDTLRPVVNVELFIRGERGCLERSEERGVVDPAAYVMVAPNTSMTCPIRDAGSSETYEPPEEIMGAPLFDIRLPGNDLPSSRWTPGQGWENCRTLCEHDDDCNAWTFRAANTSGEGSQAGCLLKSGTGSHVPDPCCVSGLKN